MSTPSKPFNRKASLDLRRMLQVRRVFQQYGLGSLINDLGLQGRHRFFAKLLLGGATAESHDRGQRLRLALQELGPVFIKLGQALSTRPDLIPDDIAAELVKLQDEVPPFDSDTAMQMIHAEFGERVNNIFKSIDPTPLASASVAQVHAATLQEGLAIEGQNSIAQANVIIKLVRPGIEKTIQRDLQVMHYFANKLQKYWSRGKQFRPAAVVQEYENTILGELDLRVEAANGARMGANFEALDIIYVPRIYWDYTSRSVLVMERIYGTSMRNIKQLKSQGVDLERLAADGVNVFFKQAFEDNFFHADMHPGNIFVSDEGRWMAIDFGIMGTLSNADKQYLAEILLGFFNRDYARITRAHFRSGWISPSTNADQFELAIRLVCEPIFAKPLAQISFGKVLMELFQTVQRFEMPVQPQLVLLYKTLLNIEGLGRQLYPQLNLWDTAKPYLESWMKEQLSPKTLIKEVTDAWPLIKVQLQSQLEQWQAPKPENIPSYPKWRYGLFCLGLGGVTIGVLQLFSYLHLPLWMSSTALVLCAVALVGLFVR